MLTYTCLDAALYGPMSKMQLGGVQEVSDSCFIGFFTTIDQ